MSRNGVEIRGGDALKRLLRDLPKSAERKVNRRAVNLATTIILGAVKDRCPVDEGDLRAAQIKKVTNKGMQADGIVGADAAAMAGDGHPGGDIESKMPAKYDHLVVYGHLQPDGTMTEPNPYLQNGWDESIDAAQAKYQSELASGIETEAAKLGSK